jgi:hypothetical protein
LETATHHLLKRLSVAWLRSQGYLAAACEVRSPIAQWVLDVAGWLDAWWDAERGQRIRLEHPQTVIIECKQSRADFLRDSRRLDALLRLRERYRGIRASIEQHRIKSLEPQLRRSGSSLFAELEEWDFESSALPAYHRTMARLERINEYVHGQTKFFRLHRYGLADLMYLAAPKGLIARRELPDGWGLLELHVDGALAIRHEPDPCAARPQNRQRLLRNIAVAASSQAASDRSPPTAASDHDAT